ncbi:MAG TPA: GNAT family N-acetyltransferase [Nocardioidaceae bacterium]|nr:GNAT family N-acetyltransferase [Nocardioidaceae bacterium]
MELRPDYPVRTSRLLLRPLDASDTDALIAYRSLEDVCRYVPFEPMDAEAVGERLRNGWSRTTLDAEGQALTLGVELAESRRLIGDVMLAWHSAEHRGGEVGWVLHPGHSGHGYATEAARAVLRMAFSKASGETRSTSRSSKTSGQPSGNALRHHPGARTVPEGMSVLQQVGAPAARVRNMKFVPPAGFEPATHGLGTRCEAPARLW